MLHSGGARRASSHPRSNYCVHYIRPVQWIRIRSETMEPDPGKITELLKAWVAGDATAREELIPLVYSKLHHLAQHYRRNVGASDTLQTTALVSEAYLRLVNVEGITWQ